MQQEQGGEPKQSQRQPETSESGCKGDGGTSTDIDKCGGEVGSRRMKDVPSVSPVMSADGVPMPSPYCMIG